MTTTKSKWLVNITFLNISYLFICDFDLFYNYEFVYFGIKNIWFLLILLVVNDPKTVETL